MEENSPNPTSSPLQKKKLKFNKTALLVAGLTILTALLLIISFSSKTPLPIPLITKEDEDVDFAHTSLSMSEEIRTSTESGVYEIDVLIDSKDNVITGGQLEISFDPSVLKNVDIKPANFLSNPSEGIKKIDQTSGKISYTLLNRLGEKGVSGTGVFATISFSKTSNEETFLEFLPETLITAENPIDESVLKETTSGVIGNLKSLEE